MLAPIHFPEGVRFALHALRRHMHGPRQYQGDAKAICTAIVEGCWNGTYFRTSRGNYPEFYARDFGMCVDSLLALGHRDRVAKTLRYALERYRKHGRFRLIINPRGTPFDFPNVYSPDGFAFLLHSLVALIDRNLVDEYRSFLQQELERFVRKVVDSKGLAKRKTHFSGMRDFALRDSSCYDNVMIAAVKKYATKLGLKHALKENYEQLIVETFWNGEYFHDDLRKTGEVTGDANVVPFWFGIVKGTKWKKVLHNLQKNKLDRPVPLRYEPHRNASRKMIWLDTLAGGWERDTVWLHLGNLFLQVQLRYDKKFARKYLAEMTKLIERERCYPEVLTKEGRLFSSVFFHSDCSMLWAANYLALSALTSPARK